MGSTVQMPILISQDSVPFWCLQFPRQKHLSHSHLPPKLPWSVHIGQYISRALGGIWCIPSLPFCVVPLIWPEMQLSRFLMHLSLPPRPVSFLDCMPDHCLLHWNQVLFLVTHIRLDFYIAVKGKPHVCFAVALEGLVAIFTASAFFLLRVCECTAMLPLWRSSHFRIY